MTVASLIHYNKTTTEKNTEKELKRQNWLAQKIQSLTASLFVLTDERLCTSQELFDTWHQQRSLTTPPAPSCGPSSFLVLSQACHRPVDRSQEPPSIIQRSTNLAVIQYRNFSSLSSPGVWHLRSDSKKVGVIKHWLL